MPGPVAGRGDPTLKSWNSIAAEAAFGQVTSPTPIDPAALATSTRALQAAVNAYNYLADDPLAEIAHATLHAIGRLVGGIHICEIFKEDGRWIDTCPVSLAHCRFGLSAGFDGRWVCSACQVDFNSDECPHIPGDTFVTTAGETQFVGSLMVEGEIDEVSLVACPREPLARFFAIEMLPEEMQEAVEGGSIVLTGPGRARCLRCLADCTGFEHDLEWLASAGSGHRLFKASRAGRHE